MALPKQVLLKVGLFDEEFLRGSDADFSIRLYEEGYTFDYSPKAILWHKNASSFKGSGSTLQDYFVTRNRIIFGFRYAPIRAKFALLRESLKYLFQSSKVKHQAVIDAILRKIPDNTQITNMTG